MHPIVLERLSFNSADICALSSTLMTMNDSELTNLECQEVRSLGLMEVLTLCHGGKLGQLPEPIRIRLYNQYRGPLGKSPVIATFCLLERSGNLNTSVI